jgi:hypothetical protein
MATYLVNSFANITACFIMARTLRNGIHMRSFFRQSTGVRTTMTLALLPTLLSIPINRYDEYRADQHSIRSTVNPNDLEAKSYYFSRLSKRKKQNEQNIKQELLNKSSEASNYIQASLLKIRAHTLDQWIKIKEKHPILKEINSRTHPSNEIRSAYFKKAAIKKCNQTHNLIRYQMSTQNERLADIPSIAR